ncbi:hypothetical protein AWH51_08485 [Clavibacter tessellarius]|uniref:Xaa-Pro dipeptidyl-peptidase C-terminal domain-containing protein n=2 Tax=Clavibacter tessellarius TaxID=31965 RepID=A0A154V227_9MICO|nr:hypothetical protein AWH51_08485 [Clavibacter michiganensis subsp. tessellarius]
MHRIRSMRPSRVRAALGALAVATAALSSVAPAAAPSAEAATGGIAAGHVLGADGRSAEVYTLADAILEHVYVQSDMDSDGDGRKDLIRVDIQRPSTPAAVTVPSIIKASGYFGTPGYPGVKPYVDPEHRATSDLAVMPGWENNYFVPRGYAILSLDVAGTNFSEGCVDDVGPHDVESVAAVIRWLHHEAGSVAYRDLDRAVPVDSGWSSGLSAVSGMSYDGGIAHAIATSAQVPGLKTVVPIEGGTSAYDTRPNGIDVGGGTAEFSKWLTEPEPAGTEAPTLPQSLRDHQAAKRKMCQPSFDAMHAQSDPQGRTDNAFWQARDYTRKVDQIARNGVSEFIVQGQNDMNVRTNELAAHWQALQRAGVTSKLWLHIGGHLDPFTFERPAWADTLLRWYDHALLGVDNGITGEPPVQIQMTPTTWQESATWPVAGSAVTTLHPGAVTAGLGALGMAPTPAAGSASFAAGRLADDRPTDLTEGAAEPTAGADRLVFTTPVLDHDVRISGTPRIAVRVTPGAGDTDVSAALVDYGPQTYVDTSVKDGSMVLTTSATWGQATPADGSSYYDEALFTRTTDSFVFTRGIGNTAHHQSLQAYTPVAAGQTIDLAWDLLPIDHVVPAGHRLGMIVYNDGRRSIAGQHRSRVVTAGSTVDLAHSSLALPVVGGTLGTTR